MTSLDEMPTTKLVAELVRRVEQANAGRCAYCCKELGKLPDGTPTCTCRMTPPKAYHDNKDLAPLRT